MRRVSTTLAICAVALSLMLIFSASGNEAFAKTVKIAFIGPLTGPNAAQGNGAKNSFDLAIKRANESGKFPYKIEMMTLDDASDPAVGGSAPLN